MTKSELQKIKIDNPKAAKIFLTWFSQRGFKVMNPDGVEMDWRFIKGPDLLRFADYVWQMAVQHADENGVR